MKLRITTAVLGAMLAAGLTISSPPSAYAGDDAASDGGSGTGGGSGTTDGGGGTGGGSGSSGK